MNILPGLFRGGGLYMCSIGSVVFVEMTHLSIYDIWFKQYLFMINLHIQYIIFYGTGFDKKLKAYKHHLLNGLVWLWCT